MLVIRLAKVLTVAALSAFAFLVTYDNLVDYGSNYQFVQHVLSMDTNIPRQHAARSRHHRSEHLASGCNCAASWPGHAIGRLPYVQGPVQIAHATQK
jgi:predicted small integral membrane protein